MSVLEGMAVTFSWLFRRPYTVQWPDKIPEPLEKTLPATYRGLLEVDTRICTACLACEKACPIEVIAIEVDRNSETKERHIVRFDVDAAKCMYCGLCVEQCPTDAIHHTTLFAATTPDIGDLVLTFIKPGERALPFKPKDAPPAAIERGAITQALLDSRRGVE